MRNKFNVNEEEKNRIRGLHSLIKEQRIDLETDPVGVDPMGPGGPIKTPMQDPDSPVGGYICPPTDMSSPFYTNSDFCNSDWCVPNVSHTDCQCCDDKPRGCMELWVTKCAGPTDPGHAVGLSNLHFPCAKIDGQQPTQMHVGQKVKKIAGSPSVYIIDTVGPNPNSSGPAANLTTNAQCDPNTGGQDQCQCCTPGGVISMNGLVPAGTCSSYNQGTQQYNCQVSPPQGVISCDSPQTWDCKSNQITSTCVAVAGSGGQFSSLSACQQQCGGEKRYACVPMETRPDRPGNTLAEQSTMTMQCVQQPNGPYTSMAQCQQNCGPKKRYCINCTESWMSVVTGTKECPPGTVQIVGGPGSFQPPCYQCDGQGICNGPGWFNGGPNVFNSQAECQSGVPGQPACDSPVQDYDCAGAQGCVAVSVGQFTGPTALADCQAVCNVDPCPAILQSWSWWQSIQTGGPKPCNNICSKIEIWIDANYPVTTNPTENQCMMDYAVSQAVAGGCTCAPPSSFITQKTNHFGNFGCCGELQSNMPVPAWACGFATGNVKPNSVCGWYGAQCTGGSLGWMKQTKCDWLDNNILGGCNCNI